MRERARGGRLGRPPGLLVKLHSVEHTPPLSAAALILLINLLAICGGRKPLKCNVTLITNDIYDGKGFCDAFL